MGLEYVESNAEICDHEGDWGLGAISLGVWFHMDYGHQKYYLHQVVKV